MKIALTTSGETLEAPLDPRFGRAPRFLVYDTDTTAFEIVDNRAGLEAAQGAGIQAAETLARLGVRGLVTGHCGPGAPRPRPGRDRGLQHRREHRRRGARGLPGGKALRDGTGVILGVASGKGGTGKTTVAVSLARVLGSGVQLLDCDVEEPNDGLFLDGWLREAQVVTVPVPRVDEGACDGCGECSRFCRFHAIVVVDGPPLVLPELCHGCGGCIRVCPKGLSARPRGASASSRCWTRGR